MTFLNPLVLLGLAAAAIPLIIHLLNLRRLRTVEFSSLKFLNELQRSTLRRLRIRQILLLVLRTLIVVTLVLAFSRPTIRGSLASIVGGRSSGTMVLILDDSPSMGTRNARGVLFDQAKDVAARILTLAGSDDRVCILPLSTLPEDTSGIPPAIGPAVASRVLSERRISSVSVPVREALRRARQLLSSSPEANREVYLLTDGQATQFPVQGARADTAPAVDERIRLHYVTVPLEETDNTAVGPARVKSRILAPGKPAEIEVTVRNHGPRPIESLPLSLYLDGARVFQKTLPLPAGGETPVNATVVPKRRGLLGGSARLDDDRFEPDNVVHFTLHVPSAISVLLVGPSGEQTRFVRAALMAAGDTSSKGLFVIREETDDRVGVTDLGQFDVVILCGIRRASAAAAAHLAGFIRQGGGLVLFPGPEGDLRNYNEVLYPALGIGPASLHATSGAEEGFLSFSRINIDHPLFSGLLENARRSSGARVPIESPRITTAFCTSSSPGRTVIALPGGRAFLSEYRTGDGSVCVFAVDAGLSWSDFAVRGIFAPLIYRTASYVGTPQPEQFSLTTGDQLVITTRLRDADPADAYQVRSPDGTDETVAPEFLAASGMARFSAGTAAAPGMYSLFRLRHATPTLLQMVPVHIVPAESDLRPAFVEDLEHVWREEGIDPANVYPLARETTIEDAVRKSRYGIELWKHFLISALALALLEMAVARDSREHPRKQT